MCLLTSLHNASRTRRRARIERFSFGRDHRLRPLLPLPIRLGLGVPHLFDEFPLPQAVIEILQLFERPDLQAAAQRHGLRRVPRRLARGRVNVVNLHVRQLADDASHLVGPVLAERYIEGALDSPLVVEIRGPRLNQHKS